MQGRDDKGRRFADTPTVVTARRALGITKMYVAITVFFIIIATFLWNPGNFISRSTNSTPSNSLSGNTAALNTTAASNSPKGSPSLVLLAVPLYVLPLIMLEMPVLILFVYDKNNGVLEYLLSLGWDQKDIYKQYLKASLLLSMLALVIFVPVNMAYSRIVYGPEIFSLVMPVYPLAALFALAAIAFSAMCMMAFSSLQKARAGSNQPLGMVVGYASTIPAYFALALPFRTGVYFDLAVIVVVALAATAMLLYSGRLIRRESFLP